jgi:hypothetical protein
MLNEYIKTYSKQYGHDYYVINYADYWCVTFIRNKVPSLIARISKSVAEKQQ